jgi:hypothetical protein
MQGSAEECSLVCIYNTLMINILCDSLQHYADLVIAVQQRPKRDFESGAFNRSATSPLPIVYWQSNSGCNRLLPDSLEPAAAVERCWADFSPNPAPFPP